MPALVFIPKYEKKLYLPGQICLKNRRTMTWKKGRGKLGLFEPLLGRWVAEEHSAQRPALRCTRTFSKVLKGKYIALNAHWQSSEIDYEDLTLFGTTALKNIGFWSFQSDGKQAQGYLANAEDIHPQAICFEAQMPSGLARQVYWPDEKEGFHWVVESKTKKGWNRFVHHHYHPAP